MAIEKSIPFLLFIFFVFDSEAGGTRTIGSMAGKAGALR